MNFFKTWISLHFENFFKSSSWVYITKKSQWSVFPAIWYFWETCVCVTDCLDDCGTALFWLWGLRSWNLAKNMYHVQIHSGQILLIKQVIKWKKTPINFHEFYTELEHTDQWVFKIIRLKFSCFIKCGSINTIIIIMLISNKRDIHNVKPEGKTTKKIHWTTEL